MQPFWRHSQVSHLFEDNLRKYIELVVVPTKSAKDSQVMRTELVGEACKIGIVRILRKRVGDQVCVQA